MTLGLPHRRWIGSHDLLKVIGASKKELEALLKRPKKLVVVIQRAFRYYLRRQWGRAERQKKRIRMLLEYRAASVIAGLIRGRLGRRKAETTKYLRVVQVEPRGHQRALALCSRTLLLLSAPDRKCPRRRRQRTVRGRAQIRSMCSLAAVRNDSPSPLPTSRSSRADRAPTPRK